MPFSPVHSARKFSVVFGTTSPYNPKVMRPEVAADYDQQAILLTTETYESNLYRQACHQSRYRRRPAHVQHDC